MDFHAELGWCSTNVSAPHFRSQMFIEWNETGFNTHGLESGILLGKEPGKGDPLPPGIVRGRRTLSPTCFLICVFIDSLTSKL